mmetsp:Transcript_27855/g.44698  ORF Transcript_27855/g.44698 Transcript_27855/m.44698 type:complete len:248 (+) Transcript_27855:521-1264(+)
MISRASRTCRPSTRTDTVPVPSAPRAVRPTRRTYSLGSLGKSNKMTWLTPDASRPRDARSVHTSISGTSPRRGGARNSSREALRRSGDSAAWYGRIRRRSSRGSARCRMFSMRRHVSILLQNSSVRADARSPLACSASSSCSSARYLRKKPDWSSTTSPPEQSTRRSSSPAAGRCNPGPCTTRRPPSKKVCNCRSTSSGMVAVTSTNCVAGPHANFSGSTCSANSKLSPRSTSHSSMTTAVRSAVSR